MDSIGEILKTEREKRGLTLEQAHETTKITVQNLSALETDRFDSFPNKVYARAFLRDYANFLGLDSGELLTAYEETWSPKTTEPPVRVRGASPWRILGYTTLLLVLLAGMSAGGYFGWKNLQRQRRAESEPGLTASQASKPDIATIPKVTPVAPPKPEPTPVPAPAPKPAPTPPAATANPAPGATPAAPPKPGPVVTPAAKPTPTTAATPGTQTIEVTATSDVWVRVKTDGKTSYNNLLKKGQSKTFTGKAINIRAGMAGAVQVKLNGQAQPSLGSMKVVGDKTFAAP